MRKLAFLLALAAALAALASTAWQAVPIEEGLVRARFAEQYPDEARLQEAPVAVQAALLDYRDEPLLSLQARSAVLEHPDMAAEILPLYGAEPEFRTILRQYGGAVLPPIHYFLHNDVRSLHLMRYLGERLDQARDSAPDAAPSQPEPDELTPQARGWYAIGFIGEEGHDFLGQFTTTDDGAVRWLQTERVLEGLNTFFADGVRTLERKARTGQSIETGDVGWAAVDALVVLGAVKALRLGRAAAMTQSAGRTGRGTALGARLVQASRLAGGAVRYGKWPALLATGYLALRHPGIMNDVLAGVAEVLQLPVAAVQFVGWLLILTPLLWLASLLGRLLLRPTLWLLRVLVTALASLERRRPVSTRGSALDSAA